MIRGLYTAATGMTVQELQQNRVANNLANASTTGFKRENYTLRTFQEVLLDRAQRSPDGIKSRAKIGSINYGAMVDSREIDFSDGMLQETGQKLDLALMGKAMFTLDTPEGLRFTKDGSFNIDGDGYLVSKDGNYVLGYQGLINVAGLEFSFTQEGELVTEDGWEVDRLLLADFNNWQRLEKAGDSMFYAPDDLEIQPATSFQLKPGFLEKPNINLINEVVDLITITRIYEANQKAIQAQDEILGKSVNELGVVR
ncbi:MAG: flagellar hook-basal body complex protein [Bacillota bacterium]